MVDDVMQMITFLWTNEPTKFGQRFTEIMAKLSAMLKANTSTQDAASAGRLQSFATNMEQRNDVEVCLASKVLVA
jgi:hypothetical protein